MAQIHFPEWRRRGRISIQVMLENSTRTQWGSVFQAIPALKEDHSKAISFIQDHGLDV
jgi:hypothetical protein